MAGIPVITDYGPDSGGRIKGLTVVKPVIIGNIAKYFGKKREDGHTHEWTVYLKPYLNEDYSVFIKKVHFKLHDSYANANRVLTKPPYEVTETGWGEFEISIRIYFNDPIERPVTVCHILKLFQAGTDPAAGNISRKTLITETYDEMIFLEPTALLKSLLDEVKPLSNTAWKHELDVAEKKQRSLDQISTAKEKVKQEILDLKEKLNISRETIEKFKTALVAAKQDGGGATPVQATPSSSTALSTSTTVSNIFFPPPSAEEPMPGTSKAGHTLIHM